MRSTFLTVTLLLAWVLPTAAQPLPDYVSVPVVSEHYVDGRYNETNPGLMIGFDLGEADDFGLAFMGGFYHNSFEKIAVVAAPRTFYAPTDYIRFNVTLGVVSGYGETGFVEVAPSGVVPMTTQSIEFGPPEFRLTLTHLPAAIGFGITTHL